MTEKERFENYLQVLWPQRNDPYLRQCNDVEPQHTYQDPDVEFAWMVWQASAAQRPDLLAPENVERVTTAPASVVAHDPYEKVYGLKRYSKEFHDIESKSKYGQYLWVPHCSICEIILPKEKLTKSDGSMIGTFTFCLRDDCRRPTKEERHGWKDNE